MQELFERHLLGSFSQEWTWRLRNFYRRNWAEDYLCTTEHPHRDQIVESVVEFQDIGSVLEIGCASGANLVRLRNALPHVHLIGVDINRKAIRVARDYFDSIGDEKVDLIVGRADRLSDIYDNSVDVVLVDAVLMFMAPDRIGKVLAEIARIASKGIVLNEYHKDGELKGLFDGGRWIYDLSALLKRCLPDADIHIKKSAFTGGDWNKYGYLIEVRRKNRP